MLAYTVWIEAEHWAPGEWNPDDANSDVQVRLPDGTSWSATFFSYQNLAALRLKNRGTGECLSGQYFWASNMILVDRLTRESVERVVRDLVQTGEFMTAFDGPTQPAA